MILSPISAFSNAIMPTVTSQQILPSIQQSNTGSVTNLVPNPSAATTAAMAALAAAQNPYAAALTAASLSSNTLISPTSSYFEGVPIYLFSGSNVTPFIMPKINEIPLSTTTLPSTPRIDTSKHFHVFVGDLSPEIDNKALRDAFSSFGEISEVKVIRDLQTLRSKGYGFVTFLKKEDAEKAIEQMNGQWLGNRTVRTNWATRKTSIASVANACTVIKERESKDRNNTTDQTVDQSNDDCGPPPARRRQIKNQTYEEIMSQASVTNTTVYIGGISSNTTEDDLKQIFTKFGTIIETRLFKQQGYAFVKFDQKESAAQAILHMNNAEMNGCQIRCSWGKETSGMGSSNQQMNLALGYNLALANGGMNNIWNQYYQCYSNPSLLQQWQTYWQQQQLTVPNGMILNPSCNSQ